MSKAKIRIVFIFLLAVFALALLLSMVFAQTAEDGTIILSEVVASNRTCPAPNGNCLDYIELHNTGSGPVDISGFMLSDKPDAIGYTFPQGTVIAAGGYAVVWCDKAAQSPFYAAFGVSSDGVDTVYLYNSSNVVIDQVTVPVLGPNVAYIRASEAWSKAALLTPGYENTEAGYNAWLKATDADELDVVITEVLPGAGCLDADGSGRITDWVELYNRGAQPADLTGAYLTDDTLDPVKWQLPQLVLQPGERKLIRCAGDEAEADEATFLLSRDGGVVLLSGKLGQQLSRVEYGNLGKDISWALQADGTYAASEQPTPGFDNTPDGYAAWLQAVGAQNTSVVISEIMSANRSVLLGSGTLPDWVELYNPGSEAADLSGCYLSDDPQNRGKWQIGQLTLQPGERKLIACAGLDAENGEANFSISRDGATLVLSGKHGNVLSTVEMPAMERDHVWALQADGSYADSGLPTPGYENTETGYGRWLETLMPFRSLAINEVMPSNSSYLRQSDGECYDWVELTNCSDETIRLSDYCLTNDPEMKELFRLPDVELAPGEYYMVILSGDTQLGGDYVHAPFTVGKDLAWLYVTAPDGSFSDLLRIWDTPVGASIGRKQGGGTYYFTKPTPAAPNGAGVLFISRTPTAVTAAGTYNDVASVSVELSGEAIRYTTDGSVPGLKSRLYTEPITLNATTVVRFASFEDGKMPSDVVTAPYIINENHTLPVVSMSMAPEDMAIYRNYTRDIEVPCNITLIEEGGGFSIDGGVEMYGHMGLTLPKKSFKVNFRGAYGQDDLIYPVFGEDGPVLYDSLVIRSGQDYPNTIFRDELFTSLCREASTSVLAQRDKHVILYINGKYWGIYTIKEAFGETMYAENYNVNIDSVSMQQAPVPTDTEMMEIIRFARQNDLSKQENYEYFCSKIDIDSLIDWMIFEGYCSNTDIPQNLRYFKSSENGDKWQFAYYDLDWGWYFHQGFIGLLSNEKADQHMPLCKAPFENQEFRERFFTRMAELKNGVLSNENVLARIDHYVQLLSPEIEREKQHWSGSYEQWENNVEKMRSYITARDHWAHLMTHMRRYVGMTNAEYKKYFGG